MTIFAMLMLSAAPEATPTCGTVVVGSYFPTVPLKNAEGKVLETLKVEKGKLPQELPVVRCSDSLVLIRWKGGLATVDRARVRFSQAMVICPEGAVAGSPENHGNAASINAFDPRCPQPKIKRTGGK